jgi:AraC-like DNA-binding protein
MLSQTVLDALSVITEEERILLEGSKKIDRSLYMDGSRDVISGKKLLQPSKLIAVRPHTRFVHFPEHSHDYVEIVYMCCGSTTHIVNGNKILLKQGDLLFMNQSATHEIYEAGIDDVAVNFIVLPDFFSTPLSLIGEEETPLHNFLVGCLCRENIGSGYLHFEVSDILPIQNLLENLLFTLMHNTPSKRKVSQMTMALLFMQLVANTEKLSPSTLEETIIWQVLRYVESNYADGSFSQLCATLHYEPSFLSRQIKQKTGRTFTELVQEKRLAQAAFLLKNTTMNVDAIAVAVGYENISYFHRLFARVYNKSPKHYRDGT